MPATEMQTDIDYALAKVAYDAYYKAAGGVSLATGDKLPEFGRLPRAIKNAWFKAAEAVAKTIKAFDDLESRNAKDVEQALGAPMPDQPGNG